MVARGLLLPSLTLGVALGAACGGPDVATSEPRPPATAAAPAAPGAKPGILLMAHGGSEAWNAEVEAAVAPLRDTWEVDVCYGMAVTSAIEASVKRLEARGVDQIAVVRLFVSGESWREETEYILGLRSELSAEKVKAHVSMSHGGHGGQGAHGAPGGQGAHGAHGGGQGAHGSQGAHGAHGGHGGHKMEPPRPIAHTAEFAMSQDGVGDSPLIDAILVDRVRALSADPPRETVLLIAHGPGDDAENERWIAGMNRRLEALRAVGAFRKIEVATLREDWPAKRAAAEAHIRAVVEAGSASGRVIVVPFRIAGFGPYRDVLKGLTYVSDGKGFLPHANMTRWIEETAGSLLAGKGEPVAER